MKGGLGSLDALPKSKEYLSLRGSQESLSALQAVFRACPALYRISFLFPVHFCTQVI
jgi:hypothetical protein